MSDVAFCDNALPQMDLDCISRAACAAKVFKTILLIEDHIGYKLVLQVMLQSMGYTVVGFSSVEEALEYLSFHSKEVSLILSDIELQGKSGLQLLSCVKSSPRTEHIPVILQSGASDAELELGMVMGAACCLQKPYCKNALHQAIKVVQQNTIKRE